VRSAVLRAMLFCDGASWVNRENETCADDRQMRRRRDECRSTTAASCAQAQRLAEASTRAEAAFRFGSACLPSIGGRAGR